ncbi:MAG: hypothetical protein QMB47_00485 [Bacteroidales bacterium]
MWKEKLSQIKDLDITVSDILEKSATEGDMEKLDNLINSCRCNLITQKFY